MRQHHMLIVILCVLGLCMASGARADSAATSERSIAEVATGVFVIRHADAPDGNPQGNTTVVVGDSAVLVVDSAYLPSSASEDILLIRKRTDKPVRYVLNTHWHPDHQRGNFTYLQAWPGAAIIAQQQMPVLMSLYEPGNLARYPQRVAALRASIASGKDAQGKRLSAVQKQELSITLASQQKVLDELMSHHMQLPTMTFDTALDLNLGGRTVQLRHSGRADTLGDAWAYLPADGILIAGDIVTAPVPYLFAGYPAEIATTLRSFVAMNPQAIIPGHGNVMRDSSYLSRELELLDTVLPQVSAEIARRGILSARFEDVAKAIDTARFRVSFAGDDPASQEYFDESIQGLIKDAFYQAPH